MSDQSSQEPTMEEILASIRRIISEDDAPPPPAEADPPEAVAPPAPAPAAPPEPEPEPVFEAASDPFANEADDEVLELTDRVESHGDLDAYKVEPPPAPVFAPEPEPVAAFAPAPAPEPAPAPAPAFTAAALSGISGSTTIEELVRQILEPQINAWAQANLKDLMDSIVRERLAEKLGQVFK